ncbi:class I SAM-dependent methyltransferase [Kineosporia sp. J2-2]|uniref:Class I SAM-dependent methyltransferase n=1 Tax=Kineosporia corallincola TaxID=2835133 RepID=A0ABS5TEJ6_9ACTN|nr:class I SAM-dependent methyltransferase [Kineosporia corallincola]MBT0768854.1 class I SAM-dependent methyltransferase [Kineosporia corallincola]
MPEGGTVADIACGRGSYGIELARRSDARLVGVDFSEVALEQARVTAGRRLDENQAEFTVGTLTETGLADRSVHGLLCSDSVQFADTIDILNEFRRILAPGGRLALTTWQATQAGDPEVPDRIRRLDLRRDLEAAGFRDVVVESRPAWRDAEKGLYEEAVGAPADGDEALASLRDEGRVALRNWDALQRIVAFATAPSIPVQDDEVGGALPSRG